MGLEFLIGLSLMATGLLGGYFLANQRVMAKRDLDFTAKADALNQNLANFSKAYDDFVLKGVDTDSRLTSLEFKINGFVNKK